MAIFSLLCVDLGYSLGIFSSVFFSGSVEEDSFSPPDWLLGALLSFEADAPLAAEVPAPEDSDNEAPTAKP